MKNMVSCLTKKGDFMLQGKTIVLGVTGSIAAYKIANLTSMLTKLHADVHVLMTQNATNFINPITFETLTNHKCLVDTFDRNFNYNIEHVSLGNKADLVLVAPASANIIAKPELPRRPSGKMLIKYVSWHYSSLLGLKYKQSRYISRLYRPDSMRLILHSNVKCTLALGWP